MRFIAEKDRLLSALSFVSKYAEISGPIPILNTMKFEAGPETVSVTATDLDKAATDRLPARVEEDGALCLPGHLLLKAIKSTSATEVQISADEKVASIQIGARTKMNLPVLPASDFPDLPFLAKGTECNFDISAEVLNRHRTEVAFAESRDLRIDIWSTGTCWEIDGGRLVLAATNRKMLSQLSFPAPASNLPRVIIPSIELPAWIGEVGVSVSKSFARFSCGHQVIATKLIDMEFPDYKRIIPNNPTILRFDRAELLASVNRVSLVSPKAVILLVGRDGKATLSACDEGREISDEVAYDGEDFQIAISHKLLAPVLGSFDCETIEFRYADHATAPTVHDPADDCRLAVLWPYNDARLTPYISQKTEAA